MKKIIKRLIILAIIVFCIFSCYIYKQKLYWYPKLKQDYTIQWHDKNLERAIRDQTRIMEGDIKLSDIWKYRSLDLRNQGIESVEDLKDLKNTLLLLLNGNKITDISPLEDMDLLMVLNLENNQVQDISAIKDMGNLAVLNLAENQITDAQLQYLGENLETLNLSDNRITNVDSLGRLQNLHRLYLDNNQIFDITPLKNLTEIGELTLTNNQIMKLIDFSNMKYLSTLRLDSNPLGEGEWENLKLPEVTVPYKAEKTNFEKASSAFDALPREMAILLIVIIAGCMLLLYKPSKNDLKKLVFAEDIVQKNLIIEILNQSGITAISKPSGLGSAFGYFAYGEELYVNESAYDRALKILQELEQQEVNQEELGNIAVSVAPEEELMQKR